MTCAEFEERIALYVGGELAPGERLAVEEHLRVCAECAALARELEEDRAWLASRPPETAEVDYVAMRMEIRRRIDRPRWIWKWIAAAAAGVRRGCEYAPRTAAPSSRGSERGRGSQGGRGGHHRAATERSGGPPPKSSARSRT